MIKIAVEAGTTKDMATGCGDGFIKQPKYDKNKTNLIISPPLTH